MLKRVHHYLHIDHACFQSCKNQDASWKDSGFGTMDRTRSRQSTSTLRLIAWLSVQILTDVLVPVSNTSNLPTIKSHREVVGSEKDEMATCYSHRKTTFRLTCTASVSPSSLVGIHNLQVYIIASLDQ